MTADGRSLPLVSARLLGSAQGGLARLVLEQRFENRHPEALHVTYRMPLPADAAVSGYAFVLDDRTITGRVERRREARERFERAVAAGHTAAVLEQDRADVFTQSIGNLPAGAALIAQVTIDQRLVWLPEGEWELRFPTVIGPRYIGPRDRAEDLRGVRVVTAPGGIAARIRIAIAIGDALAAGGRPSSPSHAVIAGERGAVELGDPPGVRLDRDIVLRWPVAGPTTGVSLAMTRSAGSDRCYGLVTIVPPAPSAAPAALARDLIVLIDTSGSMAGPPLARARQVIALLIESLGDADRLELIAFADQPQRYQPAPVAATRDEQQAAIRWLLGLSAGGGTEMRTAVIEALRALRPGAQRQVVLATDGYIAGEAEVVAQLHRDLPASSRLHFVGVGAAVNRSLATAMARAGRGAEVICDLGADPERAARRLIDRTRAPVVTDIALDGSAVIARAPAALPDVFAGSPVIAAAELGSGELVVRGRTRDGVWERRLRVGLPRPGDGNPAIAALFARERVADLEARGFAGEDRDAEIEQIGLAFQISTRLTPFLAVDERPRAHAGVRHAEVPQELPYGTTAAAFGLRDPADERGVEFDLYDDGDDAELWVEHSRVMALRQLASEGARHASDPDDVDFEDVAVGRRELAFDEPTALPEDFSSEPRDPWPADDGGIDDAIADEDTAEHAVVVPDIRARDMSRAHGQATFRPTSSEPQAPPEARMRVRRASSSLPDQGERRGSEPRADEPARVVLPGSEPPADERARREPEPLSEARREPEPLSEARMLFDLPPPPELHGRLHVEPGEPDRKPTPDLALAELELRAPEYALRAPRRLVIVLAILAVLSVLGALVWWLAH